ncbi:MAG: hypothetical protein HY908_27115 [Myxococcales bacterium]|nr:hypothetical protein [Myxococcales bacterium]
MKFASVAWGMLLAGTTVYVACASGSSDFEGVAGGNTTTSGTGAGGTGGAGGSGPECTVQCFADTDCQNTCPDAPVGSSNCCDEQTLHCYVSNMSTCPATSTGGNGQGGSAY